jgi:hypothetical protein
MPFLFSKQRQIFFDYFSSFYKISFNKAKLLLHLFSLCFELGAIPSERWIINFDKDLLDGLVFATQLGAYCPFLVRVITMHSGLLLFERT